MLRICIPVHNEATTIGVLLWRLRTVFQGFSREYDVVVYDDASTDGTGEVLEPYGSVMPLTVLRGGAHRGYAASIDALVRHVAADDEYARRDAMVLLQGDFTESPEHLPELVKRFEGGADLVAVHRTMSDATPQDERRLRRWGRWAVKPFLRLPPVADPFTGFRLVRISVLRELLKVLGNRPVCAGEGWAANIDFALNVTPFARRIENVEFAPRYDVRQRASRRRGWPDVVALFHWARAARGTVRPVPGGKANGETAHRTPIEANVVSTPAERGGRSTTLERPVRPTRPERGARGPRESGNSVRPGGAAPAIRPPRTEMERSAPAALTAESAAPEHPIAEPAVVPDEPVALAPDVETEAPAKRPRRRRRRSRRDRAANGADGATEAEEHDEALDDGSDGPDDDSGTSEVAEGEHDAGGDDANSAESGAESTEESADGSRRKRRSRRRRRGRRPGGPDAAGPDTAPSDAAEPPAA